MDASILARVLCRTDLRRGQITLLKHLYEQDEMTPHSELAEQLRGGIHPDHEQSLNGVLGAFGRRINETDGISGHPGTSAFLERKVIEGETHYQLRPNAREAIESVPALLEKFDTPWGELLESGTKIESTALTIHPST